MLNKEPLQSLKAGRLKCTELSVVVMHTDTEEGR